METRSHNHHPCHEQTYHHRTAVHTMDIKQRSDDNREDEDEEHTEFERFRQFAHFLEERSDDGKRGNGQNNDQLIERTGDEKRQTGSNSQKQHTQPQSGKHTAYILAVKHTAVVLNIFGLHLFVRTAFARHIRVRQKLTENLVTTADDEEDIRRGQHHLKRQHNRHNRLIDA